jgi:hypothetical protein
MAEKTPFGLSSPTNREWNLDIEPNGNLTVNSGDVTGGTTRITINDNNGNVGIGAANPATRLEVDGWLTVGNEGDNSQINFEAANGRTAQIGVQDDSDQGFYVRTNGQYRMSVTQGGNVGIGTVNPTEKLEVDGNLKVNGDIQIKDWTVSVPDYVFQKDYKLRRLEELRTYLNQNGHLPEIPSAQEIHTKGVNIGEFCMSLLKKIEEMSLYVLQQQEIIDIQNDRLLRLERSAGM